MENEIIWIKEDGTNNIYCCELVKAIVSETNIVYIVNCIIGSFVNVVIQRSRTFKNPVPCAMYEEYKEKHKGNLIAYTRAISVGMACYDIEKLK